MKISQQGIDLIKRFEGFRSRPYQDSVGVWTIGYGSTRGVTANMQEITEAEGERMLRGAVAVDEKHLALFLPTTLAQDQYDAICSFVYNLGVAAFRNSTLFRVIAATPGDSARITAEFGRWVYAGGKKLDGLVARRAAEAELYCKGIR